MPVIVIELFLVLGGVVLFAWWQFRDLDREKRKREARRAGDAARADAGTQAAEEPPRAP